MLPASTNPASTNPRAIHKISQQPPCAMIIRFRGKDGSYRVNVPPEAPFLDAISNLKTQLPPYEGELAVASSPTAMGETATDKWAMPISQLGIQHGDIFFISYNSVALPTAGTSVPSTNIPPEHDADSLDSKLATKEGRISREQTKLCTHGAKGMCEYCQPLEPWDSEYQSEKGIKHVSLHAWRKKTLEEGGFLDAPDYSVDRTCTNGHSPWPKGFCSRCQPPAITLQQQRFRMVDHIEFTSPKIIEQFIEFWRQTNSQRLGFLIGKYAPYDAVPLGIKAEVHAIWEPEQDNDPDTLFVKQLPTPSVLRTCELLGLQVLGVIFSDLIDLGDGSGKVVTKRHLNSYFLTSLEVLFASRLQNQYPHMLFGSRFSSRFVTCCVSGNEFGDIDVACYQASAQAEAMAASDLIVASTNPTLMRIQDPTDDRYVPDIFYKRINEYKLTVQENAKPAFPVDYLLVSLSHGFVASADLSETFTVENRPQIRGQTPAQLESALSLMTGFDVSRLLDFHLLLYLLHLGVLVKDEEVVLQELLRALSEGSEQNVAQLAFKLASGPGISTLRALAA